MRLFEPLHLISKLVSWPRTLMPTALSLASCACVSWLVHAASRRPKPQTINHRMPGHELYRVAQDRLSSTSDPIATGESLLFMVVRSVPESLWARSSAVEKLRQPNL